MRNKWLIQLDRTNWSGKGELWLDPEGNKAEVYDCELRVDNNVVNYLWVYKGETNKGSFTFNESGAIWMDSWHNPKAVNCRNVENAWGLFTGSCTYEVPSNPNWGWQNKLSERPDGSLVLQMTNITPWGEEGRAVRMVFTRLET